MTRRCRRFGAETAAAEGAARGRGGNEREGARAVAGQRRGRAGPGREMAALEGTLRGCSGQGRSVGKTELAEAAMRPV